jgi:hypothetical protein
MVDVQDIEDKEIQSLENEFHWVLKNEVPQVLKSLEQALAKCVSIFPMAMGAGSPERRGEPEKFVLHTPSTSPPEQVKVVVTLSGDVISQADINLKLPRPAGGKDLYSNTSVREDAPWQLQQVQDSANHLSEALTLVRSSKTDYQSATELSNFLTRLMSSLTRSRAALVNPKKRTLDELRNSKQVQGLVPAIPAELVVSFYLNGWKLILAVYHIVVDPKTNTSKFNRYQAECVIPWVNEVLLLLTVALQAAQQLKDKIKVFSQYPDFPTQSPI